MAEKSVKAGEAVRIITINKNHTYTLNEDALSEILLNENVKNRNVAVISVAGAMRKGKSFMLDFFLRYLNAKYVKKDAKNWLGDPNTPLKGFSWRGGSDKNTSGILIWSEVFLYDSPTGEKIAIILMDTQGIFDNESTVKDNTVIFALSTMVTSVQIYNVQNNIQEDDLQHLQLFTEYGKLALQQTGKVPFQKLLYLVRDWSNFSKEFPLGLIGGAEFLDKKLKVSNEQAPELKNIRQHIRSCFEKMECYLMPHPGFEATENPDFKGTLSEIRPMFVEQLKDFVPTILSPENLILKTMNGQKIKAYEFNHYFVAYMDYFNSDKIPNPESLLATTAKANNLSAIGVATELYSKLISSLTQKMSKIEEFDAIHNQYKQQAIDKFNSEIKIGGEEYAQKYRKQLNDTIDRIYVPIRKKAIKQIEETGNIDPEKLNIWQIIGNEIKSLFTSPLRTIKRWFS